MDENSDNMALVYIQKQEQIVLEYVRKQVDYEIKIHIMNDNILKANEKIKELTDQLINQQNISQQAINSFERLNAEFNDYKLLHQQNEELVKKLENDKNNQITENIKLKESLLAEQKRNNDLQQELTRQNDELTKLYNEENSKKKVKN